MRSLRPCGLDSAILDLLLEQWVSGWSDELHSESIYEIRDACDFRLITYLSAPSATAQATLPSDSTGL